MAFKNTIDRRRADTYNIYNKASKALNPSTENTTSKSIMVSLRLIIFLQLADLVLMSTYNFSNCDHEAIRIAFENVLFVYLEKLPEKGSELDYHGCKEEEDELLECVQNIARRCSGSQPRELWNLTRPILNKYCAGYGQVMVQQKVECQEGRANIHGKKQREKFQRSQPSEQHTLQELRAVIRSYMNIEK